MATQNISTLANAQPIGWSDARLHRMAAKKIGIGTSVARSAALSVHVANVSELENLAVYDGQSIELLGYNDAGDCDARPLYYAAASTATVDGVLVFNGPGGVGRYLVSNKSKFTLRQAGCIADWNGTSGTDNTTRLNAAFAAAIANSSELIVDGWFRSLNNVQPSLTNSFKVSGNGKSRLYFDNVGVFLLAASSTYTLASNVAKGAVAFPLVSATGIAVGDTFVISSTTVGETTYNYAKNHCSVVLAVSGNTVTLADPTKFAFPTSETLTIRAARPVKVEWSGVDIHSGAVAPSYMLAIHETQGSKISNVEFLGTSQTAQDGIQLAGALNTRITDFIGRKVRYAVIPSTGSRNTYVENISCYDCRHPITPAAFADGVWGNGITCYGCAGTVDSHPAFNVHYSNVYGVGDTQGWNFRCIGGSLSNFDVETQPAATSLCPGVDNMVDTTLWSADSHFDLSSGVFRGTGNVYVTKAALATITNVVGPTANLYLQDVGTVKKRNVSFAIEDNANATSLYTTGLIEDGKPPVLSLDVATLVVRPTFSVVADRWIQTKFQVIAATATDPKTQRVRVYTDTNHLLRTRTYDRYGFVDIRVDAFMYATTGYDARTKIWRTVLVAVPTAGLVDFTNPVSEITGQGNAGSTLAITVNNFAMTGSGTKASSFVEFDIILNSGGATTPTMSAWVTLDIFGSP